MGAVADFLARLDSASDSKHVSRAGTDRLRFRSKGVLGRGSEPGSVIPAACSGCVSRLFTACLAPRPYLSKRDRKNRSAAGVDGEMNVWTLQRRASLLAAILLLVGSSVANAQDMGTDRKQGHGP